MQPIDHLDLMPIGTARIRLTVVDDVFDNDDVPDTERLTFSYLQKYFARPESYKLLTHDHRNINGLWKECKQQGVGLRLAGFPWFERLLSQGPIPAEDYFLVDVNYVGKGDGSLRYGLTLVENYEVPAARIRLVSGEMASIGQAAVNVSGYQFIFKERQLAEDVGAWLKELITIPDLAVRLWPGYTHDWFGASVTVPHRPELAGLESKEIIRSYLRQLFGHCVEPPPSWFSDPQFELLHAEMMSLVGERCCATAGLGRNLHLGGLVILLAAADPRRAEHWLRDFRWTRTSAPILPAQSQVQAREAIFCFAQFFNELTRAEGSDCALVRWVNLQPPRLQIAFDFDCSISNKGQRISLLEKVRDLPVADGEVYLRFREMLRTSVTSSNGGRDSRYAFNLRRIEQHGDVYSLAEFVSIP